MSFSHLSFLAKMSLGDEFVEKLEAFINNDCLPKELRDLINEYSTHDVTDGIKKKPWLFHKLLARFEGESDNDIKLELDIIEILVNCYPDLVNIAVDGKDYFGSPGESYYPLHAACENWNSQYEIIEFLLKRSTKGLDHMCALGDGVAVCYYHPKPVAGTPLHYYVGTGKPDISTKVIRRLVEACPEALTMRDMNTHGLTPLHCILLPNDDGPDLDAVKLLVELNPSLLSMGDKYGRLPIHSASSNEHITPDVMKFLIKACPDSVDMRDKFLDLPLHHLLRVNYRSSRELNNAPENLKLFINACPRSVFQERDGSWRFPIQAAASCHRVEFCKLLVDLFPASVRDVQGTLAIFKACEKGYAETVKYLASIYPESIHIKYRGMNLLYFSICCGTWESVEKVKVLHEVNPSFVSTAAINRIGRHTEPLLPLHTTCMKWDMGKNRLPITPVYNLVKTLFDYYPAAIFVRTLDGKLPTDLVKAVDLEGSEVGTYYHDSLKRTISFMETQQGFMEESQSHEQLHENDVNGTLLLHRALSVKDISIGTITTIVDENPDALQVVDNCGRRPLHLACMNSSLDIVQYVLGLGTSTLSEILDAEDNNALHLACEGGNCEVVNYILDNYPSLAMVTNKKNLLPLHLLCDRTGKDIIQISCSSDVSPRGPDYYYGQEKRKEYIDSIWRMLLAYPTAVSSAINTES